MMSSYIPPNLRPFDDFKTLDQHANSTYKYFNSETALTIDQLLEKDKRLILGEPGMGKTRLLREITLRAIQVGKKAIYIDLKSVKDKNLISYILDKDTQFSGDVDNAEIFGSSDFDFSNESSVLCLDALDEVLIAYLPNISDGIKDLVDKYPNIKIYCTCRMNHYKTLPIGAFGKFSFIYIDIFSVDQVKNYLQDNEIAPNIIDETMSLFRFKNRDLIIQIPRYLDMTVRLLKENGSQIDSLIFSRSNLFEQFTYKKLEIEVDRNRKELFQKNELLKRMLEKLALIMEIYQTNIISKDELMTFFDDVKSNISSIVLSQVDVQLLYQRSLLKDNFDGTIQFENTEIQEYLAAKEIERLGHLSQTVFDLCIDPQVREIYPSWMNTLSFLVELQPHLAISMIQLSYGKSTTVQDEEYHKLVTSVNPKAILLEDKKTIFKQILEYYHNNVILMTLEVAENLGQLYDKSFRELLVGDMKLVKKFAYTKQSNIASVIGYIIGENLSEVESWKRVLLSLDYAKNIGLAKKVIFALGKSKDMKALSVVAKPLLYKGDKLVIQNIIAASIEAAPNHEFAISSFIEGTKKDQVIARYGFYSVKDKSALKLLLKKLSEDREFRSKFIEDESIFKSKDKVIIDNLSEVWDKKLEQGVIELVKDLMADAESRYSGRSVLINGILSLAQSYNSKFVLALTKALLDGKNLDGYYFSRLFSPLLTSENVAEFVDILSKDEFGREIALGTLQYKRFSSDEPSMQTYEEGRKFFSEEYHSFEAKKDPDAPLETAEKSSLLESFRSKLEPRKYFPDVFEFYYRHKDELEVSATELDRLKNLIVNSVLEPFDPGTTKLNITEHTDTGKTYTINRFIGPFGDCLVLIELLGIDSEKYRQKILNYIPFANQHHLKVIFRLISNITDTEIKKLVTVYTGKRKDHLALFAPGNFIDAVIEYNYKKAIPVLQKFIENGRFDLNTKIQALLAIDLIDPQEAYLKNVFETYVTQIKMLTLAETANELLIKTFGNTEAVIWRTDELMKRAFEFSYQEGAHFVGKEEQEISQKDFAAPIMQLSDPAFIDIIDKLAVAAFEVYDRGPSYRQYSRYLWEITMAFYGNLKQTKSYIYLQKFISKVESQFGQRAGFHELSYSFQAVKQNYLNYLGKPLTFSDCIKRYNFIKENQYLGVTNSRELLEFVISTLETEFRNWVESEGAYKFIQEATRKQEDLIQKTIKTQIENGLLKRGLRHVELRREEQLLDDKRPDMLISYGLIGPILIEFKRVDNKEIFNDGERYAYRTKLFQYLKATEAAYALYLVFQINNSYSVNEYVPKLIETYQDSKNVIVKGFNCIKEGMIVESVNGSNSPQTEAVPVEVKPQKPKRTRKKKSLI
ncbi:hypothetical protein FA11_1607 [Pelosinus fermentans A11]|uniref:Uncharacterized protein n=3 Tax=Pelosinus TaxID=365348 RepID=I9ARY5_9FIRM|nr:hypothetical protein [Pelosinus fermentans]EIW15707.1 hypothetical protein FB4_1396 [Pelosinus fermentans B4]EIW26603.1 hypothetical protein FA11_1607 [Pelosinus fermentans A11]